MVHILEKLKNQAFWTTLYKPSGSGISKRSQRGLFHGLQPRTGHQVSWSDKKHLRWFKPNAKRHRFYSDILRREMVLPVSMKALRCIDKAGGFDNYLLYTKKEKFGSKMGEILQELLKLKLKNPKLEIPYIPKTGLKKYKKKKAYLVKQQDETAWMPADVRHKDLTEFEVKPIENMTEEEKAKIDDTLGKLRRKEYSISFEQSLEYEEKRQQAIEQLRPHQEKALATLRSTLMGKGEQYEEYYRKSVELSQEIFKPRSEGDIRKDAETAQDMANKMQTAGFIPESDDTSDHLNEADFISGEEEGEDSSSSSSSDSEKRGRRGGRGGKKE